MKIIKALLFISVITLILVVLSIGTFPIWLTIPGGLLLLLSVAFTFVLDAGGKVKIWTELLENKGNVPKEDVLKRNLDLKRKIERDFSDWLDYFPENRKRNSRILLRAFDSKQYPDSNKPDKFGEYSWFAASIKSLYQNGIEFILHRIERIVVYEDKKWDFAENLEDQNLETISVYRVGRVNFSDIIDYDLKGDEHYPFPHFFCKFTYKGLPFEDEYFISLDQKYPAYFELKDKRK